MQKLSIRLHQINKILKNDKVLDNINVRFDAGKVYGLVGRNGAGKTMLLRVLAGLIRPTEGELFVNDETIDWKDLQRTLTIGLVLEDAGLDPRLNAYQNLRELASIQGQMTEPEIKDVITYVGLGPDDPKPFKKFSLGMKKRLMLAQAIMEKPDLLLLDEATNALDAEGVAWFYDLIAKERERGAIIVLTTHQKEDLETCCDVIHTMQDGCIVASEHKCKGS